MWKDNIRKVMTQRVRLQLKTHGWPGDFPMAIPLKRVWFTFVLIALPCIYSPSSHHSESLSPLGLLALLV